jgi:segregation and condensation protein B
MESNQLKMIVEGALLAAGRSLDMAQLEKLFEDELFNEEARPSREEIYAALEDIDADCAGRGFELKQTGSGYRFQVRQELSQWVNRLWEEKPKKYSRALLETLALIAYRQPITRGDIEEIRGVSVSSEIIKSLLEREWVRVVGHRDVPGRPALYATTKQFLDYFGLKNLEELPSLNDIKDIEDINPELALELAQQMSANTERDDNVVGQGGALKGSQELEIVDDESESAKPSLFAENTSTAVQEEVRVTLESADHTTHDQSEN